MTETENRSLWTQADLDRLEAGPGYPHTFGPPSAPPGDSLTPEAEQARQAVRNLGISKQQPIEETESSVTILEPGRRAQPNEIPRTVGILLKKLAGWEYRVGYSRFRTPEKTYKTGDRAGDRRGGQTVEFLWVEARTHGKRFTASYHDGKFKDAIWNERSMVNSTILKKLISGELTEPPRAEYVDRVPREEEYE